MLGAEPAFGAYNYSDQSVETQTGTYTADEGTEGKCENSRRPWGREQRRDCGLCDWVVCRGL